jgi:hypothetical protein
MAAVMVFPYVSSFPAVMASDGETTVETHEVSNAELELQYQQTELELQEKQNLETELELLINKLDQYVISSEDGLIMFDDFDLSILSDGELELYTFLNETLNYNSQKLENGEFFVDNDGVNSYDEIDFVIQGGRNGYDWAKTKIPFVGYVVTGVTVYLDSYWSTVMGWSLVGVGLGTIFSAPILQVVGTKFSTALKAFMNTSGSTYMVAAVAGGGVASVVAGAMSFGSSAVLDLAIRVLLGGVLVNYGLKYLSGGVPNWSFIGNNRGSKTTFYVIGKLSIGTQ